MGPPTLVRWLVPADLPAYKALRDDMLIAHPAAFTSDAAAESDKRPDDYRHRLGLERNDGGQFLLGAFTGRTLIGAIGCERDLHLKVRHIGKVIGMMVRDDAQRRGIGKALLEAAIRLAREADGLEMLTLTVTAGNASAVRLYERSGFAICGTVPHAIKLGDAYHAKHHMVLML